LILTLAISATKFFVKSAWTTGKNTGVKIARVANKKLKKQNLTRYYKECLMELSSKNGQLNVEQRT